MNPSMPTRPIVTPHAASVGDECSKALRQQFLDDQEDHRAAGEPQAGRKQRLEDRHEQERRHRDDGLRQARQNRVIDAPPDRRAVRAQRQRHRRAFGNVMHADRNRQQPAELDFARRVADTDRGALGNAVHEQRQQQQHRLLRALLVQALNRPSALFDNARRPREKQRARQHPAHDFDRIAASERFVGQREYRGRQHHAARRGGGDAAPSRFRAS